MRTVKLRALSWSDDLPAIGHYVASRRGRTAFLVVEVRLPKPGSKHVATFVCERRPRTELSEKGAVVHGWRWSKR